MPMPAMKTSCWCWQWHYNCIAGTDASASNNALMLISAAMLWCQYWQWHCNAGWGHVNVGRDADSSNNAMIQMLAIILMPAMIPWHSQHNTYASSDTDVDNNAMRLIPWCQEWHVVPVVYIGCILNSDKWLLIEIIFSFGQSQSRHSAVNYPMCRKCLSLLVFCYVHSNYTIFYKKMRLAYRMYRN